MSVVNKATVRRLYEEAFAQGKPEVVDEVLDANFVCHDPNSETDISHLQVALSGSTIALGVTVIALAWYGIRHGERWALLTAFLGPVSRWRWQFPCTSLMGSPRSGTLG